MWESNKTVQYLYATHGGYVWAILDGVSGWKRIRSGSPDGVANVARVLTTAKYHGRKVNVFLDDNQIERAILR